MVRHKPGNPKGVLNPEEARQHFQLFRYEPADDIGFFIEHFWMVEWDLPKAQSFKQDVLAYPSVHLVFERGNTKIHGVVTGKFTRQLQGEGKVLGIKFRPGGFYPFLQSSVSAFTDNTLPPQKVFDEDAATFEKKILATNEREEMVVLAEAFIREHVPERDVNHTNKPDH